MKTPGFFFFVIITALGTVVPGRAESPRPVREACSPDKSHLLRIEVGRPGRSGRPCQATLYRRSEREPRGREVWRRTLVNETAPTRAFVRNDGRFVITLDEFRRGGARNALVIYGAQGELLRHFLLQDLLVKDDWQHVQVGRRNVDWLDGAKCAFADESDQFIVTLKWGRQIRIDLKMLVAVDDRGRPCTGTIATVPADVMVRLLAHVEADNERVIAERLAELAELTPAEQAQAEAVTAEIAAETPPQLEELAVEEPVAEQAADEGAPAAVETAVPEDAEPVGPAPPAEPSAPAEPPQDDAEQADTLAAPQVTAGITVPAPDPVHKTDYVAWLNDLGRVDGPDANPLYEEAVALLDPDAGFEGTDLNISDAARGKPDTLLSDAFAQWRGANQAALQAFREASHYPAKGWEYHSENGDLIGVLLPNLSSMRTLAKGCVAEGRYLLATGDAEGAAGCYLDALAGGAHVGQDATLIGNLVGVAMQVMAGDAWLDLQDDPAAADLDYTQLAADVEAAYAPVRPAAEAVQLERAFYLDIAQRMWDYDPVGGRCVLNDAVLDEYSWFGESPEDQARMRDTVAEIEAAGYESMIAAGNEFYDTVSSAMRQPYPEAARRLEQLEQQMSSAESVHPALRLFAPALGRYHFIHARAEAARRATILVTRLKAYRQEHGDYPDSLDAFAGDEFTIDPFADAAFHYRRAGDSFVLYSAGGNLVDDGGVHNRKGDTNDLVFWPRPE